MRKLRVLTMLHELSLTGAPKIALDACDALHEEIDPFFVSLYEGPLSELCLRLGPLDVLSTSHREIYSINGRTYGSIPSRLYQKAKRVQARKYFTSLREKLAAWQPDVIYVNSVVSLNLLELLDVPGVPVLLHVHELDVAFKLSFNNDSPTLTTRPSRYIAVAEPVKELMVQKYGIEPERISLIHEFVPDAYLQAVASSPDKTSTGRFVVGGAGYPGWRKGTTLWLQMAAELKRILGEQQVHFIWVGTRDDAESTFFKEEARKLKIYEQIEFVPVTKTPLEHYAKFDVFAMTSYEDPCPSGRAGKHDSEETCVVFRRKRRSAGRGGRYWCIVIEDFSPTAMAAAIASLAADPERRKMLGELGP